MRPSFVFHAPYRFREMVSLSRYAADVGMRSLDIEQSENNVDPRFSIGSLGMSRPDSRTLNYMYYGFAVRKDNPRPSMVCPLTTYIRAVTDRLP